MLFDLGDLAALDARDLLRVSHVFVSRMHFIGFDALLRVHVGCPKQITITGPSGIAERVGHKLAGYDWDLVICYQDDLVFEVIEPVEADSAQALS